MFVLLSFNVLSSCPVEFQSNEPWVFDIWLILGSLKVLDNIQLVITVVVCFASLSHFYLRKPSGQGVAWSLCPKRPSWAEGPHSRDGRKAADVDLWGRRSWPQSQNQEIACAGACGARCLGQSQWEDQSLCLPWLLRSGCAQVLLRAKIVTMICTTSTSRTCFYFLGWWCFRRASLDQFCQHLGEFSWLTGMHRFDINCFWKSQDAWQTSEFATAICCCFYIKSYCETSEAVFLLQQSCQAKTWQEVKASNPPSRRFDHTAVMDAQQRMWIFGGDGVYSGQGAKVIFGLCLCVCVCAEDSCGCDAWDVEEPVQLIAAIWFSGTLHYFDIQAMFVERSCSERSRVLYDKLRQRVVYVIMSWCCHCFLIFVTCKHTIPILILWFKVAPALWHHFCRESLKISDDAWFFTASFVSEVSVNFISLLGFGRAKLSGQDMARAESQQCALQERSGHTAVMDAQQRMWIFGGCAPRVKSLYFVCVSACVFCVYI